MKKLNNKLANWFGALPKKQQSIVLDSILCALGMTAFILSLGAEQRILAP